MRFRFGPSSPDGDPILSDTGPALIELLSVARGAPPRPDLCRRLSAEGIGAVIVMPSLLPATFATRLDAAARSALGDPDWSDGQRQVYRCEAR
jgi:hypothetical protein